MSKAGLAAKADCKLRLLQIPPRSPDLNVLDYAVWSEVEKRLRQQEKRMPEGRKETRQQFEKRLDRTAASLSPAFINNAISNLQKRCQLLYKARALMRGGLVKRGVGGCLRIPLMFFCRYLAVRTGVFDGSWQFEICG